MLLTRTMDLIDVREVRVARARDDLRFGDGERPLGGGTWLYSEPQPGTTGLVDLTGLGWQPLTPSPAGLSIAATCTIAELAAFAPQPDWFAQPLFAQPLFAQPLFAQCADALLASWKIQRIATVGGNICTSLPAGPMTSLAASLDGVAVIWRADGTDDRVPVAQFVTGPQQNLLGHGDVLRSIELPASSLRARTGFRRISLAPLGRSGVLVIARLDADGAFDVTVTASTPRPRQIAFAAVPTAAQLADTLDGTVGGDWYDDAHGAPDWRRAMTLRFAEELRVELGATSPGAAS
jgi:CO/xanthine dehydrogenase FAD-binding subunit